MMHRRGQSAVEYLSVYAIAFMIVLVVIAAVYYMWTRQGTATPSCDISTDLVCTGFKITQTGNLTLIMRQTTGHSITITGINCTAEENAAQITTPVNVLISDGEMGNVSNGQPCYLASGSIASGSIGNFYKGKLFLKYTETDTLMVHSVIGRIVVKYE
ncbi:MAG: hypothetical protein NTY73_00025 [Candidatus Micrarchaeota archaeon]|nr:hypothetical protein [Candidatus Micrarchaeota archaeon]